MTGSPRVLLSFSSAYKEMAKRLRNDLHQAHIEVDYDQWEGGGSAPSFRRISGDVAGTAAVVVLLTPSEGAATWIGDEWKHDVFDRAGTLGVPVLPVRGEICAIPEFLARRSFADLRNRGRMELRRLIQSIREATGDDRTEPADDNEAEESERSSVAPTVTPIALEIGTGLASIFDGAGLNRFVTELVPMMRDGLFYELGVPIPSLLVRVVSHIPPTSVRALINEVPETEVELHPGWVVVNDSAAAMAERGFEARPAINPANGNPCAWIPGSRRHELERGGLMIWAEAEFVILATSALLRRKAADFIGLDETRTMVRKLALAFPHLVAETVDKSVSVFTLSDVLRRLVAEDVSIRNLRRIVMALAEWGRVERDPLYLTEYVRAALRRELSHRHTRGTNELLVFLLDPKVEDMIRAATVHTPTGSYVNLPPDKLRSLVDAIRISFQSLGEGVQLPVILTVMEIRAAVQRLVAPSMPLLSVTSYQELRPNLNIQPIGRITLDGNEARRAFAVVSPWKADAV